VASYESTDIDPREQRAIAVIDEIVASTRAPERLRARIEAERTRSGSIRRRRYTYTLAVAGTVAAVALIAMLWLPAGAPGGPSVSEAAALAVRGASSTGPSSDPQAPDAWLAQRVGRVYFPNWSWRFGWTAVGQRTDQIGGRRVVTVYYQNRETTIAYTIVGGSVLPRPKTTVAVWRGLKLRVLSVDGRLVVTWRRNGHTCVLSGMGVTVGQLERLASWS
jgi:hypothetical protein